MNVNGVTSAADTYGTAAYSNTKKQEETKTTKTEAAAVYEPSKSTSAERSKVIARMKADTQERLSQLQNLVTTMFKKQGVTIGTADDMWKKLAERNLTADADTIAQAKADIAEDGYWGVKQTSERLFDFAKALAGDDPEKMKKMQEAVQKGFDQATKAWGKDLPSISTDTLDAVNKLFEDYYAENNIK